MKTQVQGISNSNTQGSTGTPQLEIFHQLKTLTSVKDKEKVLANYKGDEYIQELLNLNLNPYRMFHIKDIPDYVSNPAGKQGAENYKAFVKLAHKLAERKVTGNAAKEEVRQFFMESHAEDAGIYEQILLKGPIGVGAKTVNKVFPKLVPTFGLMLAPNDIPIITQVRYPIFVQPKLDGYRCIYRKQEMRSRAGKPFANENLESYFDAMFEMADHVLDGELYAHGITFNKLQTILNNQTAPLPKNLKFVVYDCIPVLDWDHQSCKKEYQERIKSIREVLNDSIADYKKVIDIPNDLVQTSGEAIAIYKKYLKEGYEGAMLKAPDGLYRWKRTSIKSGEILKLKPFKTIDLSIEGFYEGEGKHIGSCGGFIVDHKGVKVRVGSGLDDAERKQVWENKNAYLGKMIEIRYLEVSEDGSLRNNSFVAFREDKDDCSS
jgi:ATP-dependent DNA ligase